MVPDPGRASSRPGPRAAEVRGRGESDRHLRVRDGRGADHPVEQPRHGRAASVRRRFLELDREALPGGVRAPRPRVLGRGLVRLPDPPRAGAERGHASGAAPHAARTAGRSLPDRPSHQGSRRKAPRGHDPGPGPDRPRDPPPVGGPVQRAVRAPPRGHPHGRPGYPGDPSRQSRGAAPPGVRGAGDHEASAPGAPLAGGMGADRRVLHGGGAAALPGAGSVPGRHQGRLRADRPGLVHPRADGGAERRSGRARRRDHESRGGAGLERDPGPAGRHGRSGPRRHRLHGPRGPRAGIQPGGRAHLRSQARRRARAGHGGAHHPASSPRPASPGPGALSRDRRLADPGAPFRDGRDARGRLGASGRAHDRADLRPGSSGLHRLHPRPDRTEERRACPAGRRGPAAHGRGGVAHRGLRAGSERCLHGLFREGPGGAGPPGG